jgi:3-oxoacyl-[acyl-carrier-protein] synthase II
MKQRVVITGMEIASSIGTGLDSFWASAVRGACGIKKITSYDPAPYPTQIAGEITDFSLSTLPLLDKPRRYPRAAQYALYCAHHAIVRAGLTPDELSLGATYIGTSLGGTPVLGQVWVEHQNWSQRMHLFSMDTGKKCQRSA